MSLRALADAIEKAHWLTDDDARHAEYRGARERAAAKIAEVIDEWNKEELAAILRLLRQPDDIISRIISGAEPECEHNYRSHYELVEEGKPKIIDIHRCTKCGAWKYDRDTVWQVPYVLRKIYAAARARREGR